LFYDAEGHIYSEGGKIIPSVTQILNPPASKPWFSHQTSERGTLAHDRIAAWAAKPEGFPYEPYVDSFALWTYKHGAKLISAEGIIDGLLFGQRYAGRYDLLMEIEGKIVLIDIKTGVSAKWHAAQLAAYALALTPKPARFLDLYVHDDMSYTESWISPSRFIEAMKEFKAALEAYYEVRACKAF